MRWSGRILVQVSCAVLQVRRLVCHSADLSAANAAAPDAVESGLGRCSCREFKESWPSPGFFLRHFVNLYRFSESGPGALTVWTATSG